MAKLQVYYLASAAIAVPVLERLLADSRIEVVGVGTQPDRPQGRNRQASATPIGQFCHANQIPVDKPDDANSPAFLERLQQVKPGIILVFAFGQILARELLSLPSLGCLNIHASLLPRYRGASPVQAAILAGDAVTGISIMRMTRGLDSGPVYARYELPLSSDATTPGLSDQLARLAAERISEALSAIAEGKLAAVPQDKTLASYAGRIRKEDGLIRWDRSAVHIARQVRAYLPWPGAYFPLSSGARTRQITITKAAVCDGGSTRAPGAVVQADKQAWIVACGSGALRIEKLIPEGKKEMSGTDFLRGCPLQPGILLHETNHCQSREAANSDCTYG